MLYLKLIFIALIVVYVIDLTEFPEAVKDAIYRVLTGSREKRGTDFRIKPFDCSLCMIHHVCVIYLICVGQFSLPAWAFVCLLSWLSVPMGTALRLLWRLVNAVLERLSKIIDKI